MASSFQNYLDTRFADGFQKGFSEGFSQEIAHQLQKKLEKAIYDNATKIREEKSGNIEDLMKEAIEPYDYIFKVICHIK